MMMHALEGEDDCLDDDFVPPVLLLEGEALLASWDISIGKDASLPALLASDGSLL